VKLKWLVGLVKFKVSKEKKFRESSYTKNENRTFEIK
jgi:hypothetical protein